MLTYKLILARGFKQFKIFFHNNSVGVIVFIIICVSFISFYFDDTDHKYYIMFGSIFSLMCFLSIIGIGVDIPQKWMRIHIFLTILLGWILGVWYIGGKINPEIYMRDCEASEISWFFKQEYGCTGDCDGMVSGYEWACKKYNEALWGECGGHSQDFREGCQYFRDSNFLKY